jgi:hypothetical protein
MSRTPTQNTEAKKPANARDLRLKAALKANIARRKAQATARKPSESDQTKE